ncbi:hypothetical protein PFICI_04428 [Pestalotiopsis fici W106-1]|uniref:Uncharacterized protein n=1 Tax=Pestalotiopsis fici (strain W106-1 / CGMCC3.15140) TaxID=1229662 RepID=W3XAT6_PESFW|nr:uncharacterized protein PFICI_04428 [Pestalotiopsis fici W106-1]ETS82552.1 hypothetical protein PFICI_04428 [Pestalotiopsis fici W106-1]
MPTPTEDRALSRTLLPPDSVSPVSTISPTRLGRSETSFEQYCDQQFYTEETIESSPRYDGNGHNLSYTDIDNTEYVEAPRRGPTGPPKAASLHQNGYQDSQINGTDITDSTRGTKSQALAQQSSLDASPNGKEETWIAEPWQPLCLQPPVLLSLSATFLICMLVTALLYHTSVQNNGLSAEDETRHYGWKYGPTAVLTVILYLWYSIDLSVRSLVPWQELRQGPKPAEVTLLLDYISPLSTTIIWRGLRNRHWAVVMTVAGRFLILLTTAFSTALFVLSPTEMEFINVPMSVPTFDTESFKLDSVGPFATNMYYAVNFGNLAEPLGAFSDACVPSPTIQADTQSIPSNAKIWATVAGLGFDTRCEILDIDTSTQAPKRPPPSTLGYANYSQDRYFTINVITPDCLITEAIVADIAFYDGDDSISDYQARIDSYACNLPYNYRDINSAGSGYGPLVNVSSTAWYNTTNDNRVLSTVSEVNSADNGTFVLKNITAMLCKPSYTWGNYSTFYDGASKTARVESLQTARHPTQDDLGFSQGAIAHAVMRTAEQVNTVVPNSEEYFLTPLFFGLMKLHSNVSSMHQFMDAELLQDSFLQVFNGIAAKLAYEMISNKSDKKQEIRGAVMFTQNRLHVTMLSTAIMCSAFGILAAISFGLVFLAPRSVVASKPGSVLAMVNSLDLTSDAAEILQNLGHVPDETIRGAIAPYLFTSTGSREGKAGKLTINTATEKYTALVNSRTVMKTELQWWKPLGIQDWFLFASFILPLLFILLLELYQRQSDEKNGFVEIGSRWGEAMANYIPSIISLLVGAMFASMVSACAVFAPYVGLAKRPSHFSSSVAVTYINQTGPQLGYSSLKNKHFGLSIITLAQLIASVLTIVLSGLYSTVEAPVHAGITLRRLDRFNISDALSFANPNTGLLTKLTTYYELKYPSWTYESIALPRLQVKDRSSLGEVNNGTIRSGLPGIRGDLNCTAVPPSHLNISITGYTESNVPIGMGPILSIRGSLPDDRLCDQASVNSSSSITQMPWMLNFLLKNDSTPSSFGKAAAIPSFGSVATENLRPSLECPSIAIVLGQATAMHVGTEDGWERESEWGSDSGWVPTDVDIGVLLCRSKFEQLSVDATFAWPEMELSDQEPPIIHENSSRWLNNPTTGNPAWGWDYSDPYADPGNWGSLTNTNDSYTRYGYCQNDTCFDPFILALLDGKYKVPLEQISGENKTGALMQQARGLWGRLLAQSLSQNMRSEQGFTASTPVSNSTTAPGSRPRARAENTDSVSVFYNADFEAIDSASPQRLKQNALSKVILQIMLGLMSLGVVLMRSLMDFGKVLPHNPCSIAGTMTLVVDGNLSRNTTAAMVNKQVGKKKKHKQYTALHASDENGQETQSTEPKFIMGWWNDGDTRKFGIRCIKDGD